MLGSSFRAAFEKARGSFEVVAPASGDLDLRDQAAVRAFVDDARPDAVVHAAARVAGIAAKVAAPMDFLLDNIQMDANVIESALRVGVPRLLYVGSAASYPAEYTRPYVESDLMTGRLEAANEGYGLSKTTALKLCEYASAQHHVMYRAVVPSNLYGPHDHFGSPDAHLIAAALSKVETARVMGEESVEIWGDGTARREFTYSEDLADWLVGQIPTLEAWPAWLNVGAGEDHSIAEYYEMARLVVGYAGGFRYDTAKPSGVQRRLLDSSVARRLGWQPTTTLSEGMTASYAAMRASLNDAREAQ